MSQAGALSGSGGGGTTVQTINGDTGSVTGPIVTFTGVNAGASIRFSGSGTTMSLNATDANNNTFLGLLSGNTTVTGQQNTGIGEAAALGLTSGGQNTIVGAAAGGSLTTGSTNSFFGFAAGGQLTTGGNNTLLGAQAGNNLKTGTANILIGRQAGTNYTGAESANILIRNIGVLGESNIIRIGTFGVQTATYLAGQVLTANGSAGAPAYSFATATNCGMLTDGTNTYLSGSGFATLSVGFNITLSGGITNTTQGVVTSSINAKNANFLCVYADYFYPIDTSGTAITATLMNNPITGQQLIFKDNTGNAATNAITISGVTSAKNIDGLTTYVMNIPFGSVTLIYNGTQWNII